VFESPAGIMQENGERLSLSDGARGKVQRIDDIVLHLDAIQFVAPCLTDCISRLHDNEANLRTSRAGPLTFSDVNSNIVDTSLPLVSAAGSLVPLHFPVTYAHYMKTNANHIFEPEHLEEVDHAELRSVGPFDIISILQVCMVT